MSGKIATSSTRISNWPAIRFGRRVSSRKAEAVASAAAPLSTEPAGAAVLTTG